MNSETHSFLVGIFEDLNSNLFHKFRYLVHSVKPIKGFYSK